MAHSIPLSPPIGLVRLPSLARPAHLNAHCTTDANMRTHLSSPTSRRSYCPRLTIAPPLPPAWKEGFTTRVSHSLSLHFPSSLSLLLNWPNILPQILPGPLKAIGFDTASSPLSSPPPRPLPLYKPLPQPPLPFLPLTIHTRLETSSRRRSLSLRRRCRRAPTELRRGQDLLSSRRHQLWLCSVSANLDRPFTTPEDCWNPVLPELTPTFPSPPPFWVIHGPRPSFHRAHALSDRHSAMWQA